MHATPTLLVFTLGPRRERARRRLLPGAAGPLETALHDRCLHRAVQAGRQAGCRVVVAAPAEQDLDSDVLQISQRGGSFGRRLGAAVRQAETLGRGPLLVVGSDVPGLRAEHLRQALERLEEDPCRLVVGPSPDGGFYLLGTAGPVAGLLAQVRWRRRSTLRSLRAAVKRSGRSLITLSPLADLDDRSSLERWLSVADSGRFWARLAGRLLRLLREASRPRVPARVPVPRLETSRNHGKRAPPALFIR